MMCVVISRCRLEIGGAFIGFDMLGKSLGCSIDRKLITDNTHFYHIYCFHFLCPLSRFMHRTQLRYCIEHMIRTEIFSEFLKDKVPKEQVRYIPLGSETSILALDILIERAVKKHNARNFVLGKISNKWLNR